MRVYVRAARFYKLSGREVIPISFMVPRLNKDFFQDDLVRTSFPLGLTDQMPLLPTIACAVVLINAWWRVVCVLCVVCV